MSNLEQGVTAVVGAVVGFYVSGGNPSGAAYGFQIGPMAGQALFPLQQAKVFGPRLEDVHAAVATGVIDTPSS